LNAGSADFQKLWSYSTGFYGVWIAHIGKTTGLLELLAGKSLTPSELASSASFFPPAVRAWCSAALAYGFITKAAGGRLKLRRSMKSMLLDKAHPDYLGGQFSYLALRSLQYASMQDLFKNGKTRPIAFDFEAVDEATHWDHYAFLRVVRSDGALHRLLTRGCTLADIGCGTGSLIAKLCKRYPNSRYFGIDPSKEAVASAKKRLKGKPATIKRMSAEMLSFTEKFDIVYLGESLYTAADKRVFAVNCYRALRQGGTIMILEGLIPERKVAQEDLLIMGMQLDFALQGRQFLTKQELKKLLREAGFTNVGFRSLGGSVYLTSATKRSLGAKKAQ
jgi:ubiquinone/menaquinone biosynthesis C-methylase UbiE